MGRNAMTPENAFDVRVGDFVHPDEWRFGENLVESDGYKDSSFPGCQFRLPSIVDNATRYAVNVTITGVKELPQGGVRCRIEFVGDGEPSTFCKGRIVKRGR